MFGEGSSFTLCVVYLWLESRAETKNARAAAAGGDPRTEAVRFSVQGGGDSPRRVCWELAPIIAAQLERLN